MPSIGFSSLKGFLFLGFKESTGGGRKVQQKIVELSIFGDFLIQT